MTAKQDEFSALIDLCGKIVEERVVTSSGELLEFYKLLPEVLRQQQQEIAAPAAARRRA